MQKSFKIQFILLSIFAAVTVFGQNVTKTVSMRGNDIILRTCTNTGIPANCNASIHPVFGSSTKKPLRLNFLGSSKQFAELGKNVGESPNEIYTNLQRIYSTRKPHAAELDRLLKAMGYTGFRDPNFTADKIKPKVEVPAGTTGMIGNAKHSYQWVVLGKSFYGFEIQALNGCNVFFMQNCGNAFHSANPNIYSFLGDCRDSVITTGAPKCLTQTLSGNANASQSVSGQFNGNQEIRILARNQGEKDKGAVLCIGKATIPYNASYELMVDGVATANSAVQVCASNSNLVIPIVLSLKKGLTKENKVSFGADGRTYIDVTQKQYNSLGKIFEKCCPNDCAPAK